MKSVRLSLIGNKHPSFINDSLCHCYKKLWSKYKKNWTNRDWDFQIMYPSPSYF